MEFSWTTFILEIINFLVLVWILKRFLYVPIQKTIANRKAAVQAVLDDANKKHEEAIDLQNQYENRLQDWEGEKDKKRLQLQHDIQQEKEAALMNLTKILEKEQEKNKAREKQRIDNIIYKNKREAVNEAAAFSAKILQYFADKYLEQKIIDLFIHEIKSLSKEKINALKQEIDQNEKNVQVKSAYEILDDCKKNITQVLEEILAQKDLSFSFIQDRELMAGLYVCIGSLVFQANLKDELRFFSNILGE